MLTHEQIRFILERIGEKTVVEPTKSFPYRISVEGHGYSDDKKIGAIQATLSVMLETSEK